MERKNRKSGSTILSLTLTPVQQGTRGRAHWHSVLAPPGTNDTGGGVTGMGILTLGTGHCHNKLKSSMKIVTSITT